MLQSQLKEGQRVTCTIYGRVVNDAKVHFEGGRWYICQNDLDGNRSNDRLGYRHSWSLKDNPDEIEGNNDVTNFRIKKLQKRKFKVSLYKP